MKIEIEKGVPAPIQVKRTSKYPFRDMVVGDSFFINDKVDVKRMQQKVAAAACMFVRKNPSYKFKTQAFPAGVRLWRVA
jgi:hypothetical protein